MLTFRGEISRIKAEGIAKRTHVDLYEVDTAQLDDNDLVIWDHVTNRTINRENLREYEKTVVGARDVILPGVSLSRLNFLRFVRNRAMAIFTERSVEEMDAEKSK